MMSRVDDIDGVLFIF